MLLDSKERRREYRNFLENNRQSRCKMSFNLNYKGYASERLILKEKFPPLMLA
jgi:hypothetical protein